MIGLLQSVSQASVMVAGRVVEKLKSSEGAGPCLKTGMTLKPLRSDSQETPSKPLY
jgi:hypothetical protein